jgi:hypothetical protein
MKPFPLTPAGPDDAGEPFRDWLTRRLGANRRKAERLLAFIQQWDHLDGAEPRSIRAYAERWNASEATVYRLMDEFRGVFPGEDDPDRLLEALHDGAKQYAARTGLWAALVDVPVRRTLETKVRDLRELLPSVVAGTLQHPIYEKGRLIAEEGDAYEAYECEGDRYAWSPARSSATGEYVSYILEGDADDDWMPGPGQPEVHADWADGELKSGVRWAQANGYELVRVGIKALEPAIRPTPGSRPRRRP